MPNIQEAKCFEVKVQILPPLGTPRLAQKKNFASRKFCLPQIYLCIRSCQFRRDMKFEQIIVPGLGSTKSLDFLQPHCVQLPIYTSPSNYLAIYLSKLLHLSIQLSIYTFPSIYLYILRHLAIYLYSFIQLYIYLSI